MIEDGVGHVLQCHCSVAKKTTLRIMLRIVPDEGREGGRERHANYDVITDILLYHVLHCGKKQYLIWNLCVNCQYYIVNTRVHKNGRLEEERVTP